MTDRVSGISRNESSYVKNENTRRLARGNSASGSRSSIIPSTSSHTELSQSLRIPPIEHPNGENTTTIPPHPSHQISSPLRPKPPKEEHIPIPTSRSRPLPSSLQDRTHRTMSHIGPPLPLIDFAAMKSVKMEPLRTIQGIADFASLPNYFQGDAPFPSIYQVSTNASSLNIHETQPQNRLPELSTATGSKPSHSFPLLTSNPMSSTIPESSSSAKVHYKPFNDPILDEILSEAIASEPLPSDPITSIGLGDSLGDPLRPKRLMKWFLARIHRENNWKQSKMYSQHVSRLHPTSCSTTKQTILSSLLRDNDLCSDTSQTNTHMPSLRSVDIHEWRIYESQLHTQNLEQRNRILQQLSAKEAMLFSRLYPQRMNCGLGGGLVGVAMPPESYEGTNITGILGQFYVGDQSTTATESNGVVLPEGTLPSLFFDSDFESGNLESASRVIGRDGLMPTISHSNLRTDTTNNTSQNPRCSMLSPVPVDQEYDLRLRPDLFTEGNFQWYYFGVTAPSSRHGVELTYPLTVRFNITNLQKKDSLYNYGMRPAVLEIRAGSDSPLNSTRSVSYENSGEGSPRLFPSPWTPRSGSTSPRDGQFSSRGGNEQINERWSHGGRDICYYRSGHNQGNRKSSTTNQKTTIKSRKSSSNSTTPNPSSERNSSQRPLYTLSFTYTFTEPNTTVYFAHAYPFTYTDHQRWLTNLYENNPSLHTYCHRKILCHTLAGNPVDLLTITERGDDVTESRNRPAVILSARVHPGETMSSFALIGAVDFLVGNSLMARVLRRSFVFSVIPMLNPDGVIHGHTRCSLAATDLNRRYQQVQSWNPISGSATFLDGINNGNLNSITPPVAEFVADGPPDPASSLFPTIQAFKTLVQTIATQRHVALAVDFHGHSRKKNAFLYGCDPSAVSSEKIGAYLSNLLGVDGLEKQRVFSRVFPRILSSVSDRLNGLRVQEGSLICKTSTEETTDDITVTCDGNETITSSVASKQHRFGTGSGYFNYSDHRFNISQDKFGTGRVMAWREAGILSSLTLEISFCGVGDNKEQRLIRRYADQSTAGLTYGLPANIFSSRANPSTDNTNNPRGFGPSCACEYCQQLNDGSLPDSGIPNWELASRCPLMPNNLSNTFERFARGELREKTRHFRKSDLRAIGAQLLVSLFYSSDLVPILRKIQTEESLGSMDGPVGLENRSNVFPGVTNPSNETCGIEHSDEDESKGYLTSNGNACEEDDEEEDSPILAESDLEILDTLFARYAASSIALHSAIPTASAVTTNPTMQSSPFATSYSLSDPVIDLLPLIEAGGSHLFLCDPLASLVVPSIPSSLIRWQAEVMSRLLCHYSDWVNALTISTNSNMSLADINGPASTLLRANNSVSFFPRVLEILATPQEEKNLLTAMGLRSTNSTPTPLPGNTLTPETEDDAESCDGSDSEPSVDTARGVTTKLFRKVRSGRQVGSRRDTQRSDIASLMAALRMSAAKRRKRDSEARRDSEERHVAMIAKQIEDAATAAAATAITQVPTTTTNSTPKTRPRLRPTTAGTTGRVFSRPVYGRNSIYIPPTTARQQILAAAATAAAAAATSSNVGNTVYDGIVPPGGVGVGSRPVVAPVQIKVLDFGGSNTNHGRAEKLTRGMAAANGHTLVPGGKSRDATPPNVLILCDRALTAERGERASNASSGLLPVIDDPNITLSATGSFQSLPRPVRPMSAPSTPPISPMQRRRQFAVQNMEMDVSSHAAPSISLVCEGVSRLGNGSFSSNIGGQLSTSNRDSTASQLAHAIAVAAANAAAATNELDTSSPNVPPVPSHPSPVLRSLGGLTTSSTTPNPNNGNQPLISGALSSLMVLNSTSNPSPSLVSTGAYVLSSTSHTPPASSPLRPVFRPRHSASRTRHENNPL